MRQDKTIGQSKILGELNGEREDLCVLVDKMEEIYAVFVTMDIIQFYDLLFHYQCSNFIEFQQNEYYFFF